MLLIAVVAVILLVVLKCLPMKCITLIEGVFDRKKDSSDFYEKVIAFWFDNQCRECIEKNSEQESLYGQCHICVPATAINLDSKIEPQNGDSIKIIAWKTIFGRVMAYKLVRTNFADEFAEQQLNKEDDEWKTYWDASDRREAMKRRLNLEEYRQVKKEEEIQYAAEHKKDLADMRADMREFIRSTPMENYGCMEYSHLHVHRSLYNEYITTGTSSNQKLTEHLAECSKCLSGFSEMRKRFLESHDPDCLTAYEYSTIRISGLEPKNRKDHINKCYHCWILFSQCKEEHISSKPGPECLTKDNLHIIHTTGEIPEACKTHLINCLRCQKASDKHRGAFIDKVVPQPKLPKTRFKSIRAKYKKQTTI